MRDGQTEPIRVLFVEDLEIDVERALHQMRRAGLDCAWRRVETGSALRSALDEFEPTIVLSDFSTTGDGLVTALQLLSVVAQSGKPVSEICNRFEPLPQVLKNVRYKNGGQPLDNVGVQRAINDGKSKLGKRGRLVIRPSGTCPKVPITSGWPLWPTNTMWRPASTCRSAWRWTLLTSGQVASRYSSPRSSASAGTAYTGDGASARGRASAGTPGRNDDGAQEPEGRGHEAGSSGDG